MKPDAIARDYVARASRCLGHARESLDQGWLADAVRFAQDATELSLKAALRWAGIDYPHAHDVVQVLVLNRDRFPIWFTEGWEATLPLWQELARLRGVLLYGMEMEGRPSSEVVTDKGEARRLVYSGMRANGLAKRLLGKE